MDPQPKERLRPHLFQSPMEVGELGLSVGPCILCGKSFTNVPAVPANCTGGKN